MKKNILVAAGLSLLASLSSAQLNTFHSLNSKATFYRTSSDPLAIDTTPIDLGSLGLFSGDQLGIIRIGRYSHQFDGLPEIGTSLNGVFSASQVLLPSGLQNRVQDAIEAGNDVFTGPTFTGGFATDIDQDFQVSPFGAPAPVGVSIVIPSSATHLFLAASSSFYGDNTDPDGNFGYILTAKRTVTIDVKPGTDDNTINTRSKSVPVAILGAANLDVNQLDLASIRFGGAPIRLKNNGTFHVEFLDVNGDFVVDALLQFDVEDLTLLPSATSASLTGRLTNLVSIEGADSVRFVP